MVESVSGSRGEMNARLYSRSGCLRSLDPYDVPVAPVSNVLDISGDVRYHTWRVKSYRRARGSEVDMSYRREGEGWTARALCSQFNP